MNDNDQQSKQPLTEVIPPQNKIPDEAPSLHLEARFKITDPESGQVLVEGRA